MKYVLAHILLLVLLIPTIGIGQENAALETFFSNLAKRDAKLEKDLLLSNTRDYLDFWKDQERFENLLKKENPKAYSIYLKEKARAYYLHTLDCDEQCKHNVYYLNKRTFYFLKGIEENEITFARSSTKKSQIKN